MVKREQKRKLDALFDNTELQLMLFYCGLTNHFSCNQDDSQFLENSECDFQVHNAWRLPSTLRMRNTKTRSHTKGGIAARLKTV